MGEAEPGRPSLPPSLARSDLSGVELPNQYIPYWITSSRNKVHYIPTEDQDDLELEPVTEAGAAAGGRPTFQARVRPAEPSSGSSAQTDHSPRGQLVLNQLINLASDGQSRRMKFSHSLLFNSVPEWASYYLK